MPASRLHSPSLLVSLSLCLLVWLASPALILASDDTKPATKKPTYQVDASASRVFIKAASATRLGHPHGVEGKLKSGKVAFGGAGTLVFDMTSFEADTMEARKRVGLAGKKVSKNEAKKVTTAMRSSAVLDVEEYPTATYRITAVMPLDKQAPGQAGAYRLEGRFTLRGKEQKLQIKAKVERAGKGGLKMTGSFTLRQTDYGITPYSALGGLAKVADELEIWGDLVLKPAR
jgi:polyisoprenoid-binding protein YceI